MSKQVQFSFAQVTELHQYLTGFVLHASCALGSRLLLQLFEIPLKGYFAVRADWTIIEQLLNILHRHKFRWNFLSKVGL